MLLRKNTYFIKYIENNYQKHLTRVIKCCIFTTSNKQNHKAMKTHEMTTDQIFQTIKNGEANIETVAVCGNLFNTGNDPFFIRIEGEKIIGMKKVSTGYDIDKISLVSETPDSELMKLAVRVKQSADEAKRLSDEMMDSTNYELFFIK